MTWLNNAAAWAEKTGRDIKRKGEELERTYRPAVERAVSEADARIRAHRAAMEKVGWLADLARAPKKGNAGRRPAPSAPARTPAPLALRGTRTPTRYLLDPSTPENAHLMTTRAPNDPEGKVEGPRAYINPRLASNVGVAPWSDAELVDRMKAFAAGAAVDAGPRVTFVNDKPQNPTPYQPLTVPTAQMAASAIWNSGASSVNVNSTTGGHEEVPKSWHNYGRAVDINKINGEPVASANPAQVGALQDAFLRQPNIGQDLGPTYNLIMPGRTPVRSQRTILQHKNHVHGGGRQ